MRLISITLQNFRGYHEFIKIPVTAITTLIGKNDAGKSTILDALDIYFNENKSKFSIFDRNIHCKDNEETIIGCEFSDFPDEIIIDETAPTSLYEEHLLNRNGNLEIIKSFSSNAKETVYLIANHPSNSGYENLFTKKNADLKALVNKNRLTDQCNLTVNGEMRKALWDSLGSAITFCEQRINADKEDGKKLWERLKAYLPTYALFKADRPSTDEDSEAQDPIHLAVSQAIANQAEELEQIKSQVVAEVETVAERTIEKLKEFDPALASTLSPRFRKEPAWDKAFSFSLTGDEDIPINKRGSGVRRLVLFSFFRASVECDNQNSIIYAVEEPETSQHPDFQREIVETFQEMVLSDKCQIIITTHVPGLAGLLPISSLRFITDNDGERTIETVTDNCDELLKTIQNTLGVLPEIYSQNCSTAVKVIVCVEGPNDVQFMYRISHILHEYDNNYIDLSVDPSIACIPLGGGTLQQWTNYDYLKRLGIPEYHLYDRDGDSHYQAFCDIVNGRKDGSSARITSKRETENYIHPDAIHEIFGITIHIDDNTDVPKTISTILKQREDSGSSESKVKVKLNTDVVNKMTLERLAESDPRHDIINWLTEIKAMVEKV